MKICVPTNGQGGMDDSVSAHFGRAPTYTIVDTETGQVKVVENRSDHMGGSGKPPEQVAGTGAEVVICSGLGPNAITMLSARGIASYTGATGTVKEALESYTHGRLTRATEETACKEHHH